MWYENTEGDWSDGGYSDWSAGDAYAEPRTSSTVSDDLSMASQGVDDSGTGSGWSGFFLGAAQKLLTQGLSREAAKTNIELQRQREQALSTRPLVSTSGGSLGVSPMGALLVGGVLLAVVLVATGGRK